MKKNPVSYRLSDDARQLVKLLAQRLGVNETAVLELSIRELAEKKRVKVDGRYKESKENSEA